MLRDNPVDIVKIDGEWVKNATLDPVSRTAVASITECAHLLGAEVVAEWVEDEATRSLMGELGVEYVQGYLIAKPKPLDMILGAALPDAA